MFPAPEVDVAIVSTGTQGRVAILIHVPASSAAPHAVRKEHDLRYFVRDGERKRPLSESEVRNLYRLRFSVARDQDQRLSEVFQRGSAKVSRADFGWICLAVVPSIPVDALLSIERVSAIENAIREYQRAKATPLGALRGLPLEFSPSVRRVEVADSRVSSNLCLQLYLDGAAFGAMRAVLPVQHALIGGPDAPDDAQQWHVGDELAVCVMIDLLGVFSQHMIEVGAGGDAVSRVGILFERPGLNASKAVALSSERTMLGGALSGSRWTREFEAADRSIALVPLQQTLAREFMLTARLLLGDLLSNFGLVAPLQVSADGALVLQQFVGRHQRVMLDWARQVGIDVLEA